jgi:hypothetical protein
MKTALHYLLKNMVSWYDSHCNASSAMSGLLSRLKPCVPLGGHNSQLGKKGWMVAMDTLDGQPEATDDEVKANAAEPVRRGQASGCR